MINDKMPKVKTTHVLLVNVNDRQVAMLRMAFKMYNSINYVLVQEKEGISPDLVLVDGDDKQGNEIWHQMKERFPDAKIVFFARNQPTFTAPYLAKPITFNTLFTNLRQLEQGNGIWLADNMAGNEGVAENKPQDTAAEPESVLSSILNPKEEVKTAHPEVQQSATITQFNIHGTLLNQVRELAQQTEDMAIIVDNKPVLIVFPGIKKVLLVLGSNELRQLCEKSARQWAVRNVPPTANLHEKARLSIQACIWQLAIWTANGRLIEPVTPNTVLKLRAWPNMTRLAYLPEAMRLSAFLVRSPVTLNTLYKLLPVSLEHVLNYIAATYTIGSLVIDKPVVENTLPKDQEMTLTRTQPQPQTVQKSMAGSHETEENNDAAKSKGLLSRLMDRIRGN